MKNILYIVEDEESAQFRYRVKNVIEALECSKKWRAEYLVRTRIIEAEKMLSDVDVVVILRQTAKDDKLLDLIKKAHEMNLKVLFDLDDLIFDYRDLLVLMRSTNSKNILYWAGYFWGIRRVAKRVDGFICTNDFLARKLKRSFDKPVKVIRNSLNREQIEISEKFIKKKKVREIGDRKFTIGYFSGSPTHAKDFGLVEEELVRFLNEHKDAVLRVVGEMEFSHEMKRWIEGGRVEVSNKVDYLRLQGLEARVDVNIAPLVVNDFTNCKSELKFFEVAVVETTTIASPTYAFKKAISDGKNGFLARPGEWYDRLEYLYKNPKKNREVALEAKKYALKHYYGAEFLKEVEEAYG